MPYAPDLSGRALEDRYELRAVIGEGAFGRVYEGRDRRLDRPVAVKVIKPWWTEDPEWVAAFERETRLLARVSDPGIVQIFDVGHAPEGLYYVAELVEGENLTTPGGRSRSRTTSDRGPRTASDVRMRTWPRARVCGADLTLDGGSTENACLTQTLGEGAMSSYDYVIAGAGSAGCVLAARLSEDPDVTVCLLEAGPPDTADEIHLPAGVLALGTSKFDWTFISDPEPGLAGRQRYLPRGRTLGGSSSSNAMCYVRGNRVDYDGWAAMGHDGWGWDDVLPYFLRAEDNERGAGELHGAGGPLSVIDGRSRYRTCEAFIEAGEQAGLPRNDDFNGPEQDGVGWYQVTQRNGMRCSAAVAYLHPVLGRPNLTVITGAHVTRLLLDGDRATGVEVDRDDELAEIGAEREVLLSAGAYQSPQILLLSGIGPSADLELVGIPCVHELPVGRGLQDHPATWMTYTTGEASLLSAETEENLGLLTTEGRGPLTSNFAESGGFLRTDDSLTAPDIQLHMIPVLFPEAGAGEVRVDGWALSACLLRPTSEGFVKLRSRVPTAKPRILHNYVVSGEDRAALVKGVRRAVQIAGQPALAGVTTGAYGAPAGDDDASLIAHIERNTTTLYHPVGTCGMGRVVDSELRVLGMESLRVIDASVMPTPVRGNTNAPTIMIAERAADLIRGVSASAGAVATASGED